MADSQEVQRVLDAISALEQIADDEDCARAATELLERWPAAHSRLRELRQQRVQRLRDAGRTWKEIGNLLGVSVPRAQQIAQGKRGTKRGGEEE